MTCGRIVHLGLGNFHRAHQAVYTALADDGWTITGVAHRSHRVVDALRAQGMRYTVVTIGGEDVRVDPIDVVDEAFVADDEADAVVARIAHPHTRIVSLTITEAGYTPDGLMIALLRRGLRGRAADCAGPVTLLSCDNLSGNGEVLRRILTDDTESDEYLGEQASFPSTMVDRIVPATAAEHVALARAGGYDDAVPVPAEPFRQWVLQPGFAAGRPSWERAGAVFTDDVRAWETVKVRMLNGTHSLIAYLGLLRGHRLVAAAFADGVIRGAADALGDEYAPTLRVPAELDLAGYRAALAQRFANSALAHRCEQVGSDGSLKLLQRVPEAALWHLSRGRTPSVLALLVASFLHCSCHEVRLAGQPVDPAGRQLRTLGTSHPDPAELAQVAITEVFGADLAEHADFVARVAMLLAVLEKHGTGAAIRDALS